MKRVTSDKKIIWFETVIITLMLVLLLSLVHSMMHVDLSSLPNRELFNLVALFVSMALSIAIAFSIRLNHRVYADWHVAFMLILVVNYVCMYLDSWIWVHSTTPMATGKSVLMVAFQIVGVLLMHTSYILFVYRLSDRKKLMRLSIIICLCSLLGFTLYIFYFNKASFPATYVAQHLGESRLLVAESCLFMLIVTSIPAFFSHISVKWKMAVASYPFLFSLIVLAHFWNSDYLFTFQAISLGCMCCYALMYTDNDSTGRVTEGENYQIPDIPGQLIETKTVSVMKVSLRDFSYVATYLNESITIDITNAFLKEMMDTVSFFGGKVVAFPSCSFIALFGAEENSSGFRARAIGAALEIIEKMEKLNAWCKEKDYPRIYVSTSVVTDTMSLGYVGDDEYRRFTILGEATELCDQLEKACGESEALVSESTLENYITPIYVQKRGVLKKKDNSFMNYFKISKVRQQI